ncbi:hypothetical protein FQA47_018080 [Oryzias melastigma]|uniref:Uncharacterized protein n=1 Tax=Oryzias melastigma TaxID=30732 RepID=A0A834F6V7_ORYME|nr:hypothetical protein FQA47_018080 [Oryzias melastigma]
MKEKKNSGGIYQQPPGKHSSVYVSALCVKAPQKHLRGFNRQTPVLREAERSDIRDSIVQFNHNKVLTAERRRGHAAAAEANMSRQGANARRGSARLGSVSAPR